MIGPEALFNGGWSIICYLIGIGVGWYIFKKEVKKEQRG